jgi:putative ABC transport system permease protein
VHLHRVRALEVRPRVRTPYKSPAAFVAVAILAGMLAAILPARRASKLNVLEALQYE